MKLKPDYCKGHYLSGSALNKIGKYKKAIKSFNKVIELEGGNAAIHYQLGLAFISLRKYQEAIINYDKAISLNNNFSGAYNDKGNIFALQKKYRDAIELYDQAIKIHPLSATYHYNKGLSLENLKLTRTMFKDLVSTTDLKKVYRYGVGN